MLTAHLCAVRCNTPFSSVKVDLGPLSCAQLPGTNEYQWGEPECRFHRIVPAIAVDCPQELCNVSGIGESCAILNFDGRQGAAQICSRIALGTTRSDCVPNNLAYTLLASMRCFDFSSSLESPKDFQKFRRGQSGNRPCTDKGEQQVLEGPSRFRVGLRRKRLLGEPFPSDRLKGVGIACAERPLLGRRISSRLDRRSHLRALLHAPP